MIGRHLADCFDVYPIYGREPEAAKGIHKKFIDTLAPYPPEAIDQAFEAYYRYGMEFPVPAHIVSIIERKNKPSYDPATFRYIQSIPRDQRAPDDWDYLKGYVTFKKYGRC